MQNLSVIARIRQRSKLRNVLFHCAEKMTESSDEVMRHIQRSERISYTTFEVNLGMFTNEACAALFRFGQGELQKIVKIMSWPADRRCTNGNGYSVNPTLAA